MRITADQRAANENRIRAATDRLLRGNIPPGGRCDIKTLARELGVDRTAFYGSRPYAYLRAEFEKRLQALQQAGDQPDPRDAQITRLCHRASHTVTVRRASGRRHYPCDPPRKGRSLMTSTHRRARGGRATVRHVLSRSGPKT